MNPLAQGVGIEVVQQRSDFALALGIPADERRVGLGMGDVHATDTRQQELAAHRRHGIEHLDRQARLGQCFGGHQAGGAAADDDSEGRGGGAQIRHGGQQAVEKRRILAQRSLWKHCSKNDQSFAGLACKGLQRLSRRLSTSGSTVIVNNR
ncbi:hypothetical protein D3C72_997160 [compost metagenome]